MSRNRRSHLMRLYKHYPYCHWCQQRVVPPPAPAPQGFRPPKDMATLDHVYSRLSTDDPMLRREKVLACHECNHRRGEQDCTQRYKDEHRKRSTQYSYAKV